MREYCELQDLFLKEKSFDRFSDVDVLGTFLSAAGIRSDTESMVQTMLDTYGSFKGLLEARPDHLAQLPGVSGKAALLVSMIAPLAGFWERCNMDNASFIRNTHEATAFCKSILCGKRVENFYVICLNCRCKIVGYRCISHGTLSEVSAYPRSVIETALNYRLDAYKTALKSKTWRMTASTLVETSKVAPNLSLVGAFYTFISLPNKEIQLFEDADGRIYMTFAHKNDYYIMSNFKDFAIAEIIFNDDMSSFILYSDGCADLFE